MCVLEELNAAEGKLEAARAFVDCTHAAEGPVPTPSALKQAGDAMRSVGIPIPNFFTELILDKSLTLETNQRNFERFAALLCCTKDGEGLQMLPEPCREKYQGETTMNTLVTLLRASNNIGVARPLMRPRHSSGKGNYGCRAFWGNCRPSFAV